MRGAAFRAAADEVSVDVEVVVADEGEVTTLCAVEVEHGAIATDEAGVIADGTITIAIRLAI